MCPLANRRLHVCGWLAVYVVCASLLKNIRDDYELSMFDLGRSSFASLGSVVDSRVSLRFRESNRLA